MALSLPRSPELLSALEQALAEGCILPSTLSNIQAFLNRNDVVPWATDSLQELIASKAWNELDDRFYKMLSFGTGGIRGRTIGKIITRAEQGAGGPLGRPEHTAIGVQMVNDWTLHAATQGLVRYLIRYFKTSSPSLVFSHDTRHFSRYFAELAAQVASQMGAQVFLFKADRSTPELSFAIRHLKAHAGAMITASHNPPHDNGFKAYFSDGGQLVEPHASAVMEEVTALQTGGALPSSLPATSPGKITLIGEEIDLAYTESLKHILLERKILETNTPHAIYTPLHGTGVHIIPRLFQQLNIPCTLEPEQAIGDGRFPTISSPNPENPRAFEKGIARARQKKAELVIATDPDADRLGVCTLHRDGEYHHLTGNQIGSILAAYRLERLFAQGILTPRNAARAAIFKTFVTTDLQKAIAKKWGVRCVETLTGFKYFGAKMLAYEKAAGGRAADDSLETWRKKLLEKSTYYIFGAEESYGFSMSDEVRDKDAHAAALAIVEAAAYAHSKEMNLMEYLDTLYLEYGLFLEKATHLTFEGAEGALCIQKLLASYKEKPPARLSDLGLVGFQNFAEEVILDIDGEELPKELMLIFHFEKNFRMVVRASGTEPKVKFYFFGYMPVESKANLDAAKKALAEKLSQLWSEVELDARKRIS